DGACDYIPAHPELVPPATIRARTVAVHEASHLVYVSASPLPAPAALEAGLLPIRSIYLYASHTSVRDAFARLVFPPLSSGLPGWQLAPLNDRPWQTVGWHRGHEALEARYERSTLAD